MKEEIKRIGLSRYYDGPKIILENKSFKGAEKTINNEKEKWTKRYKLNHKHCYYYDKKFLWEEFQILFLIQFVEFRLTEIISYLYNAGKIKPDYVDKMFEKAKKQGEKNKNRIFSPRVILVIFKMSLGRMIDEIIKKNTSDFFRKTELLSMTKEFNNERCDFVHKSFNNCTDIDATIKLLDISGRDLLRIFDSIEGHYYK